MNILFSPLGKTDPIKYNHDGAMLHICRYFDIDKVYMYMSKEICDEEDKDKRFSYCIERLGELLGKKIDREFIRKDDLTDGVEKFDVFTNEFGSIINEICANMSDEDILYLNISSGTPAMKATLHYLVTVIPYKMIPVQVTTPEKKSNSRHEVREGFDPALEWEYNEDNDNCVNRCTVSELAAYGAMVQKKMVITLLEKYDYVGAWELAKTIRSSLSVEAFDLICAAKDRYMLNHRSAKALFDKYSICAIDVVNADFIDICEYLLRLDLMVRKGEYLDFLRGVTPIISDLFEIVIKVSCGFDIRSYCEKNKKGVWTWSADKLENSTKLAAVLDGMNKPYIDCAYYSSQMIKIIEAFSNSDELTEHCKLLREVDSLRNTAAHEIVYISAEKIKSNTKSRDYPKGITPDDILRSFVFVLKKCGINVGKNYLSSYDRMNEILIKTMTVVVT